MKQQIAILLTTMIMLSACSASHEMVSHSNSSTQLLDTSENRAAGQKLYVSHCSGCHGSFENTAKKNIGLGQLSDAISTVGSMRPLADKLSIADMDALVLALSTGRPAGDGQAPVPTLAWDKLQPKTCAPVAVASRGSLLDPTEYRNAIEDIFALKLDTSKLPHAETKFYRAGENSGAYSVMDLSHLELLLSLSETAAQAVKNNLSIIATRLSSCNIADPDAAKAKNCQNDLIARSLSLLFRRPLAFTNPLVTSVLKGQENLPFPEKFAAVIQIGMNSPEFLYHLESNSQGGNKIRSLTDAEAASRLSFLIWNSVPDRALLDRVAAADLLVPSMLALQVERMLADPKASRFTVKLADEWLDLNELKNRTSLPGATTAKLNELQNKTRAFMTGLYSQGRDFRDFYRAQDGFLNQGSFAALTSGGSATDPIYRGVYVAKRLLCGSFGSPPPNATSTDIGGTTKLEVIRNRSKLSSCRGCHQTMDPIGYALEPLSQLGGLRSTDEQGQPVGTEAVTLFSGHQVRNPSELSAAISENAQTGACFSQMLYKFATRGPADFEEPATSCEVNNMTTLAYRSGNSIKDYVLQLTQSTLFLNKLETNQ